MEPCDEPGPETEQELRPMTVEGGDEQEGKAEALGPEWEQDRNDFLRRELRGRVRVRVQQDRKP